MTQHIIRAGLETLYRRRRLNMANSE